MSKQWRRRLAVVAVETQYGVAPDPATATILEVVMLDAGNPYAGNTVERERMRYGFGNFEQINTGPSVERQIRVPFAGSGTAGEPPAYSRRRPSAGNSRRTRYLRNRRGCPKPTVLAIQPHRPLQPPRKRP